MLCYNTLNHAATKFTPYELVFGKNATLPSNLNKPVEYKYTYDNYLDELKFKLQRSHELAKENNISGKEINIMIRNLKL